MSWMLFLQGLMCVLAGGYVARMLSTGIRALVVRAMPLEKRISDESFHIQARTTTIIAAAIALLLAGAAFWGVERAKKWITQGETGVHEQTAIIPFYEPPSPGPPTPTTNVGPPTDSVVATTEAISKPTPPAEQTTITALYYLQLGAYDNPQLARAHYQLVLARHGPLARQLHLPATRGAHKVLLGPFSSRKAASAYRQQYQLEAFVRKLAQ